MRILVLMAMMTALAAGCSQSKNRVLFEGAYFRANAEAVDKKTSRALFDVTVRDPGQSIDGAREAGRYEGTKYCIKNYGTSRIEWSVSPDAEPGDLQIVDGRLFFRGRCRP